MSKQIHGGMDILRKTFVVLLVLDFVGLILTGITLAPTFRQLAGYGQIMLVVVGVIVAVIAGVMVFEILAKIFLIRSTSPMFSWGSGRKGYTAAAKLLLLFNFCAVIVSVLSAGGEGATLINQGYLWLRVLASVVEMVAAVAYLRTVKKLFQA